MTVLKGKVEQGIHDHIHSDKIQRVSAHGQNPVRGNNDDRVADDRRQQCAQKRSNRPPYGLMRVKRNMNTGAKCYDKQEKNA